MAQIESGGKGRKPSVDLNLVPFIDLMSVLITFLLITAVWSQVSMIQIGSSLYGKKSADQKPEVSPQADVPLKLDIFETGYVVTLGSRRTSIPLTSDREYDDQALIEALKTAKQQFPEKVDAAIAMADKLPYERLIKGMDTFLKAGFPQISVLTGGPK